MKNLLLGEDNELKNRDMHITGTIKAPKCQSVGTFVTLDVTLEESNVLSLIKSTPYITQDQIAKAINKSTRTVKRIIDSLKEKGIVSREGGKRFGHWKINVN